MANLSGQNLGPYKIIRLIGEGGMAAVYQAHQESMKRDVAIKVIKTNMIEVEDFAQRFQREAQMVASLSHAHILKVFDYGRQDDIVYLVMELLTGGSLEDLIEKGPVPVNRALAIIDEIAGALDYAHQKGIIHRDLKPGNVLLDESGSAFLTDFGLARLMNTSQKLTQSGTAIGTPAYMAPEQWRGLPVDARADVYALGILLFHMLAGVLPFNGDSTLSMMYLHMHELPPSLTGHNPEIPDAVESVVEKALAKEPEDRFQSAGQLAAAFHAAVEKQESVVITSSTKTPVRLAAQPAATVPTKAQSDADAPKSRALWIGVGFGVVLVALGLGIWGVSRFLPASNTPTAALVSNFVSPTTADTGIGTFVAQTETAKGTGTANAIASFTKTSTPTLTLTNSPTVTLLPTNTVTPTVTNTLTPTASDTLTPTVSNTLTPTATNTPPLSAALVNSVVAPVSPALSCPIITTQPPPPDSSGPPSNHSPHTLTGHTAPVNSVALTADAKLVVSGSDDGTARLWTVATGKLTLTFDDHKKNPIKSVAISPDGSTLLTGGGDPDAHLWDMKTGQPIRNLSGHTGTINSVAFSSDGNYVLTASDDQSAKLWDVKTGTLLQTFSGTHSGVILAAAFSADDHCIVTGSADTTAVVWDVKSGAPLETLTGHTGAVQAVAFSMDDHYLLTGSADGTAKMWDVQKGTASLTLDNKGQGISSVAFTPDPHNLQLLTAGQDGYVKAWDGQTGQQKGYPAAKTKPVRGFVLGGPGIPLLVTAVEDNTVRIWVLGQKPPQP